MSTQLLNFGGRLLKFIMTVILDFSNLKKRGISKKLTRDEISNRKFDAFQKIMPLREK